MSPDPAFWAGKRVLVTGHTGFKGSWATLWLAEMGARVSGIALPPDTWPSLHHAARVGDAVESLIVDIRDRAALERAVARAQPELILHMAAQALVRPSYRDPVTTFETNVIGTVHLLEAARTLPGLAAVLVVTTDKVYENAEAGRPFAEADPLGGHDPYSASKAAAEIVTASYRRSFARGGASIVAARAGNVIGGGDFAEDRIVPDIWRAAARGVPPVLRYPDATRPWQHVLDCLAGYLLYLEAAATGAEVPPALNFGPDPGAGEAEVAQLTRAMQEALGAAPGWQQETGDFPHEMARLSLDAGAARAALGWRDRFDTAGAIARTAAWYRAFDAGEDMAAFTRAQIADYCA